jgi:hypothetical protein
MFSINLLCPICNHGSIGFRKCKDGHTLVMVCDECDSVWLGPTKVSAKEAIYTIAPEFIVPGTDCSLIDSRWAEKDEIIEAGWAEFIGGEL